MKAGGRLQQTTPRRRCVLEFVSPDQAGEIDDEMSSILWRCHRFSTIDRAVDIQVVHGRWWFLFYEGPVRVPEACDGSRDCLVFEGGRQMRLILLFGIPTPGARRCGRFRECE